MNNVLEFPNKTNQKKDVALELTNRLTLEVFDKIEDFFHGNIDVFQNKGIISLALTRILKAAIKTSFENNPEGYDKSIDIVCRMLKDEKWT